MKTKGGNGDHIAIKENLSPSENLTPNYYDPFGDKDYKV
jgi:hypothetical protein